MNVALVYDRVNKWGGAERVLLVLHELFPKAPLFTLVYDKQAAPWARVFDVRPTVLQHIPFARRNHELFAAFAPLLFEQFSFEQYDLVLSVTSAEAKSIITKPNTTHICYCLTPTRYLWSHHADYVKNPVVRRLLSPVTSYMRSVDQITAYRPDSYIAISNQVKKRIADYYHQDALVIYPPCNIPELGSDSVDVREKSDFFLIVSRLVSYKRIEIAIEACNTERLPLVIIGKGRDEDYLKSLAGPTIQFVSDLTDSELAWYYRQCRALVVTQEEDFGLSIVEAQGWGKPVIAFREGGALDILEEGKTGTFFHPQQAGALREKLKTFHPDQYSSIACKENAKRFGKNRFKIEMQNYIHAYLAKMNKTIRYN